MDEATSEAAMGNSSSANRLTEQVTSTEARPNKPKEDNKTQMNIIHQMFSEGYDYAYIEQYMNKNHAPVGSVVRQELWLTFNRERLSELLRFHHSEVLDLVRSDPATFNRPDLLTEDDCAVLRSEMSRRLQEVEQSFHEVKWGAKLRNHAKWEYLKDEIVSLYRWLKRQNTYGRGMNTVRAEMTRRYGELFDSRDTTYFTKISDWGESSSSLGGSSQHATPWSQPDTPFQPTTPFDNNAVPENDNWAPGTTETAQYFYPAPLLVHNKPATFPPELPLSNGKLLLQPPLPLQSSSKLVSAEDIDSDLESHESHCSIATVSTIFSEIQTVIDEVMIDYEQPGPLVPAADAEPIFDDLVDWEGNASERYEDIQMQEVEDAGSVRHNTSMQEVQGDGGNVRFIDSGYADDELTTLSDTTQSAGMTEPVLGSASNHISRSRFSRPRNIAGGPTALLDVALQISPRTQRLAKEFGKSAENLRIFSKIQEIQAESAPSLHHTPPLHHPLPSHHTLALHHLAATIYDPDRKFDSMMDLTRSLLPQCRNVLTPDKDGNTPGHIALASPRKLYQPEYPTLWWIRTWLGNGNDGIMCRNDKGETILHYAARNGYKSVVTELLRRGADHNAKNNVGRSVIQVCDSALNRANDQVKIAQMTAPADYTLAWEARAVESARIADCAQLLRYHLG
ncbi:hypothetical protein BDZ45DRAFT_697407 [Acephala macrosclerotiorum]|nr:hypothetical protein BDZ45DRAFT_697407 [Acephala macrosclerotiorum]